MQQVKCVCVCGVCVCGVCVCVCVCLCAAEPSVERVTGRDTIKCSSERRKPVWEQKGAVQCVACSAGSETRED